MLKKFTDFANEKNNIEKDVGETVQKSVAKVQKPNKEEPKEDENTKIPKIEEEPKMEKFDFVGKVVKSPKGIKPSVSIIMLEQNNVSKEKLHFILSKQTEDSLVVLKYNEKTDMKLTEFVNTLISYYKKNEKLTKPFNDIVVEGNEHFSIIKNIPKITIGDNKLIDVLNDSLVKLLK